MKTYLLALVALTLSVGANAADVNEAEANVATATTSHELPADAAEQLAQELEAMKAQQESGAADAIQPWPPHNPHHPPTHYYWHCTAYPNGQGHGHGHSGYSYDYYTAYYQALNSCQYYHGYCHVHCHQDHR